MSQKEPVIAAGKTTVPARVRMTVAVLTMPAIAVQGTAAAIAAVTAGQQNQ